MNDTQKPTKDHSMKAILASIRRIITDDEDVKVTTVEEFDYSFDLVNMVWHWG